jgi:hypothetical protein
MKKIIFVISLVIVCSYDFFSFAGNFTSPSEHGPSERVSFKIKGTGSKNIFVTIGIGNKVGWGACCSGVGPNSTVGFVGEVGYVVYDGKSRRIITKIYKEMEGQTIDLADYY